MKDWEGAAEQRDITHNCLASIGFNATALTLMRTSSAAGVGLEAETISKGPPCCLAWYRDGIF